MRRWRPDSKNQELLLNHGDNNVAKQAIRVQKRLTSVIIPPTMQLSTCTYVVVDKK
jgi:hypothetical protein